MDEDGGDGMWAGSLVFRCISTQRTTAPITATQNGLRTRTVVYDRCVSELKTNVPKRERRR